MPNFYALTTSASLTILNPSAQETLECYRRCHSTLDEVIEFHYQAGVQIPISIPRSALSA